MQSRERTGDLESGECGVYEDEGSGRYGNLRGFTRYFMC